MNTKHTNRKHINLFGIFLIMTAVVIIITGIFVSITVKKHIMNVSKNKTKITTFSNEYKCTHVSTESWTDGGGEFHQKTTYTFKKITHNGICSPSITTSDGPYEKGEIVTVACIDMQYPVNMALNLCDIKYSKTEKINGDIEEMTKQAVDKATNAAHKEVVIFIIFNTLVTVAIGWILTTNGIISIARNRQR